MFEYGGLVYSRIKVGVCSTVLCTMASNLSSAITFKVLISKSSWQLGRPEREDTTLDLWLEMIAEITAPQEEPKTPAESS